MFMKFNSDDATNATIIVSKWDDDSVEGTFSARLRTLEGAYRTLEGSFKTFYSSDSRGLDLEPSMRLDAANSRYRRIGIRIEN